MANVLVIVGCGSAKADEPKAAKHLYTAVYFQKKRAYAEDIGDEWMICSAEHGLIAPDASISPYDTGIGDLDEDDRDEWADKINCTLSDWVAHTRNNGGDVQRIEVLAGRLYIDPLRERDVFANLSDTPVKFPLQAEHIDGIGDQIGWLNSVIDDEAPTCNRCGRETKITTLGGDRFCEHCLNRRREQDQTRDDTQHGLGEWSA